MKNRRVVVGIAVAVGVIILFLSPLGKAGFIAGHDTGYHLTRVQLFTQALREGQFPVRWIEGPVPGITHPLFLFYPPLFYYPAAALMILGMPYETATYTVLALTTVLAFTGMYCFVKNITGNPIAALAAATLFLFTPYRVSQFYVRAAYGELLATAFLPWAFLSIRKLVDDDGSQRTPWLPAWRSLAGPVLTLGIALSAMVLSHQPTAIIAAFPLAVWTIYLWVRTRNARGILRVGLSCAIAFGLSAFFVVPLVAESGLIRAARLSGGYFDFRGHFALLSQLVYSAWGWGVSVRGALDGMSFQVGIINWMVVVGGAWLLLYNVYNNYKNYNDYILFFLSLFLFSLFMATEASLPIWERFGIMGFIQYPWRFLLLSSFTTSVTGGLVCYNLYNLYKNYTHYISLLIFIPVLFNLKYLAPSAMMTAGTFDLRNPSLARYNSPENPFFGVELGYFPVWVSQVNTDPATKRFSVTRGNADITPGTDTMIRQEAELYVKEVTTIRVNTHYFPGWVASIDDLPASASAQAIQAGGKTTKTVIPAYDNPQGNMEVTLPAGNYRLAFTLDKTPIRRMADYLSLGSALAVASAAILMIAPKRFWSKYAGAISPARVKRTKA
jgi:hypothetical protein